MVDWIQWEGGFWELKKRVSKESLELVLRKKRFSKWSLSAKGRRKLQSASYQRNRDTGREKQEIRGMEEVGQIKEYIKANREEKEEEEINWLTLSSAQNKQVGCRLWKNKARRNWWPKGCSRTIKANRRGKEGWSIVSMEDTSGWGNRRRKRWENGQDKPEAKLMDLTKAQKSLY